jgi:hypothetical protein
LEYLSGNGDRGHLEGDAAAVLMTLALIRATAAVDRDRGTVGIENPDFVPAPGSTATSARNPAALTPGTGRLAADNPDHRVQVRKIAIRITMTAITATAVFVIVTNV